MKTLLAILLLISFRVSAQDSERDIPNPTMAGPYSGTFPANPYMGFGYMPPPTVKVICAGETVAPKPAACDNTQVYCDYVAVDCTTIELPPTLPPMTLPPDFPPRPLSSKSHVVCDSLDGKTCPDPTACVTTGVSKKVREALREKDLEGHPRTRRDSEVTR